jgi:hypothetical protein
MVTKGTDYSTVFNKSIDQPKSYEIITSFQQNPKNNQTQQNEPLTTTGNFNQEQITILSQLPFWIPDTNYHEYRFDKTNEKCCFNHYVGLPWKHGRRWPLHDYEIADQFQGKHSIFSSYENNDCTWILKSTGLGVTELSLRYMCWKAFTGSEQQYKDSKMVIVVGPNLTLAIELMDRIRSMFLDRLGVTFDSSKTRITLPPNNVTIQAYPSNHVDAFRGLPKVSALLIDEGDFFRIGEQKAVRDAAERYLGKSRAKIFVVSTPNEPGGLMETIQREEDSIYYKLMLDYTVGLNKIFNDTDIARAKQSPSFEREYNLKYAYGIGDLFLESTIQKCLDIKYDPTQIVWEAPKAIGIDPAYGGSSKFAYVASQYVDGRIQIIAAEEFERPDPKEMETFSLDMIRRLKLFQDQTQNGQILVDGANVAFIKYLKSMLNENTNYEDDEDKILKYKRVRPINFGTSHRKLLTNMIELVAKGYVAIDERYEDLLNQMRIAKVDANYGLIKKPLSLDLIDALRLSLYGYELT